MKKLLGILFLLPVVAFGQVSGKAKSHPDYVPNEITAEHIAEAVLIAQYGEDRVKAQLPLKAFSNYGDFWIVQGSEPGPLHTGGGMAVWINKHSGCIDNVLEHMK
jgi:hypothetical protein